MTASSATTLPLCYSQRHHYQETLHRLATSGWGTGLMVKQDGELCQVGLLRLCAEKIKGLLGGKWGLDRAKQEWVEYHVIHFLEVGAQNQWLAVADLPLICSLAQRAGVVPFAELESAHAGLQPHAILQGVVSRIAQAVLGPVSSADQTAVAPFFYDTSVGQSTAFWRLHQSGALASFQGDLIHLQRAVNEAWLAAKEVQFQEIWHDPARRKAVFREAIADGDSALVQRFLAENVDLDDEDEKECTPLMAAIDSGRPEIIKLLLAAGADLCKPNSNGINAMCWAVLGKHADIAKLCVEQARDIQAIFLQATPLHMAAQEGHAEVIKLLLARGADVHALREGWTPLYYAAHYGHAESVKLLLEAGAERGKVNLDGDRPLHMAVKGGHAAVVPLLIKSKGEMYAFNTAGASPLSLAASCGHTRIVKWFVKHGANIEHGDKSGQTLLHCAAATGNLELLTFLLTKGANVHKTDLQGKAAIHWAIEKGQVEMVKWLLAAGADVNQANSRWEMSLELLKSIFPGKRRMNKARIGRTPLQVAAKKGHVEIVRLLLEAGADVHKADLRGMTPLHAAIRKEHLDIVNMLIAKGADVDAVCSLELRILWINLFKSRFVWQSPLSLAGLTGNVELTKFFLDKHSGNLQPSDAVRCLPAAVKSADITKNLLEKGLDVHGIFNGGWSPLAFAKALHSKECEAVAALIVGKDPRVLPYAKEFLWRKTLAHVTDQQGKSRIVTPDSTTTHMELTYMCTEGCFWETIAKRSAMFAKECAVMPKEFTQILVEAARFAAAGHAPAETLARWQAGNPIFLDSGFNGHYMGILLWKDQLVMASLGGSPSDPQHGHVESFTFDESCLTEELLAQIADCRSKRQAKIAFFAKLTDQLKCHLRLFNHVLAAIPMPAQTVENCTWFNSAGLVLPLQVMHAYNERRKVGPVNDAALQALIAEQQQMFAQWRSYQRVYALQKYLKTIEQGGRQQPPDFGLVGRAFAYSYPYETLDKLDAALMQRWRDTEALFVRHVPVWHQVRFQARKRLLAAVQSLANYLA